MFCQIRKRLNVLGAGQGTSFSKNYVANFLKWIQSLQKMAAKYRVVYMGGNLLTVQSLILMSYFCFVFSKTYLLWPGVVPWQKLKEFLKIYAWRNVHILLFGPLMLWFTVFSKGLFFPVWGLNMSYHDFPLEGPYIIWSLRISPMKSYRIEKVLVHLGKLGGQLLFVVIHVLHDLFVTSAGTFIPEIELRSPEKWSSAAILVILFTKSSS